MRRVVFLEVRSLLFLLARGGLLHAQRLFSFPWFYRMANGRLGPRQKRPFFFPLEKLLCSGKRVAI